MECPKCKAQNDDAAVFCSLCYESFKAKPKPAAGGGAGKKLCFPRVVTTWEGWTAIGPLVVTENGLYFFVKGLKPPGHEGSGSNVGKQIGENFGLLGYVVGAAAGSMLDHTLDEGKEGAGVYKPDKIALEPATSVMSQCQDLLGVAPDLLNCKEFFSFKKPEIKAMSVSFLSALQVHSRFLYFEVSDIDDTDKLTAFLKRGGYPIS